MAKIQLLSEDLIGKIAAGEVVERPAAAIKELVENSIDAGAKAITIEITGGGIESFRVTDDGSGIEESDIRLAFERHATSKIRSEGDLDAIGTLGFRGEALASIAAVSRVTMTTRTEKMDAGVRVKNEGGNFVSFEEAACARGTSIWVRDLFYNVPVRREFLKKPGAEGNAVSDLVERLILSHPEIRFRYLSGGKMILRSAGDGKIESAAGSVYGARAVENMRKTDGRENGVIVSGLVGIGENARGNRGGESFFINGRYLKSPVLSGAVEDACRERVMIGKYPVCVMYLTIPYGNVNINVHPNKMEVRFRDEKGVRDAVFHAVLDALKERDALEKPTEMWPAETPGIRHVNQFVPNARVEKKSVVPEVKIGEKPQAVFETGRFGRKVEENRPESGNAAERQQTGKPVAETENQAAVETIAAVRVPDGGRGERENKPESETAEQMSLETPGILKPMKIFGAVFDTFILIEYDDQLLLVDQHAVHERLLFERMMNAYRGGRAGQELLVPYIVNVTRSEMNLLEENRELLEGIGLRVEEFGEGEAAIRCVPVVLGESESVEFLRETLDELQRGKMPGEDQKRARILQMACKHAVKGGERLTEDQLRSLVEEMVRTHVTPTCPHGRPLVVAITHRELDRKFKRIQ